MKYPTIVLFTAAVLAGSAAAQDVGTCQHGEAEAFLDVNNVRAAIYNNGNLFHGPRGGNRYIVPKQHEASAIFGANLWVAGKVNGELRLNASEYGPWMFWPGPLDESGNPPDRCDDYDRIYHIDSESLLAFEETGQTSRDLSEWPADLGAPVIDGDGVTGNYNLEGGDRPALIGDQMLWWVMNDKGNHPRRSIDDERSVATVGLEVRATAFAMNGTQALPNHPLISSIEQALKHTTFYRYEISYHGSDPLDSAWVGIWFDPSLGNAADNYVGSDSALGLGYAYNGDEFDDGFTGYGETPPAVGADFFRGPVILPDGVDNDADGAIDEEDERTGMQVFWLYHKSIFNPFNPEQTYLAMQGFWPDGSPMIRGGSGGLSDREHGPLTRYMFSGNPPAFWSEDRLTPEGGRNTPSNRRIMMSAGPFRMRPGDTEEIVVGIVWARARSRHHSVYKLKFDDALLQSVFDELIQPRLAKRNVPDPKAYTLVHNHPNPFSERTTITYKLPQNENVRLTIYDMLGRRISILVDRNQPAGIHDATFEAGNLPSGIYFYRLEAGPVTGVRKMAVVR